MLGLGKPCEVLLNGTVKAGAECEVAVELNGNALDCNSDNGWRLKGRDTVELTGSACAAFQADQQAAIHIAVSCGAFELL